MSGFGRRPVAGFVHPNFSMPKKLEQFFKDFSNDDGTISLRANNSQRWFTRMDPKCSTLIKRSIVQNDDLASMDSR